MASDIVVPVLTVLSPLYIVQRLEAEHDEDDELGGHLSLLKFGLVYRTNRPIYRRFHSVFKISLNFEIRTKFGPKFMNFVETDDGRYWGSYQYLDPCP
jgi:hypothetical protein